VVDWAGNHDTIIVTGNAIFEGNMLFRGKLVCNALAWLAAAVHADCDPGGTRPSAAALGMPVAAV
jgi:hypothetical protein